MTKQHCQIVIDTNILVAGLRSQKGAAYKLLRILNDTRWQINISTTLLVEYEEILLRERRKIGLTQQDIDDVLDGICHLANQQDIFYIWRPTARDPDDDFLIDLAVAAQADYIVTYNKKDLRKAKLFGIDLVSPKEFLQIMEVLPR